MSSFSQATEIKPEDYMARLGSRLRVHYNKEMGRYTASFGGVYEKIGQDVRQPIFGIARTEMEACRALAVKMRDLSRIGRLEVLQDENDLKARVMSANLSCNTWMKKA